MLHVPVPLDLSENQNPQLFGRIGLSIITSFLKEVYNEIASEGVCTIYAYFFVRK